MRKIARTRQELTQNLHEIEKSRFFRTLNTMMTPKMHDSLTVVAELHGVKTPFMARTILMTFLDLPPGAREIQTSWIDDVGKRTQNVQVGLCLTVEMQDRIGELAHFMACSKAQVVRIAVRHYLSQHYATRPVARTTETALSHVNGGAAG